MLSTSPVYLITSYFNKSNLHYNGNYFSNSCGGMVVIDGRMSFDPIYICFRLREQQRAEEEERSKENGEEHE